MHGAVEHVTRHTSHVTRHTSHVTRHASGKLFDLLNNRKKLIAREDGNAKVTCDV